MTTMDDYNNNFPPPDPAVAHSSRMAWGAALVALGGCAVAMISRGYPLDWLFFVQVAGGAMIAGGAVFAVSYAVIKLSPILYPEFLYRAEQVEELRRRMDEISDQVRQDATAPPPAPLARNLEGNLFRVGKTMRPLPDNLDPHWLRVIATERAAGRMTTISLRELDAVGISRNGNGESPAAVTLGFLLEMGAVRSVGDRRPYEWTAAGALAFPSPVSAPATPVFVSGVSTTAATATTGTTYTPLAPLPVWDDNED